MVHPLIVSYINENDDVLLSLSLVDTTLGTGVGGWGSTGARCSGVSSIAPTTEQQ